MATFPVPAQLNGSKLAEELRAAGWECHHIYDIVVAGDELQVNAKGQGTTPVADVVAAHSGGLSSTQQATSDWRAKLQSEIAAISAALTDPTTNWTSTAVIKRLARNQLRILRYIRQQEMDAGT